jgi:hypothetical protein
VFFVSHFHPKWKTKIGFGSGRWKLYCVDQEWPLDWCELSGPSASADGDASRLSASHIFLFIHSSSRSPCLCATEKLWQALPQPLAIFSMFTRDTLLTPRSTPLQYVRCSPHLSAASSNRGTDQVSIRRGPCCRHALSRKKTFSAHIRCPDRRRSSALRRVSGVKERALAERKICQPRRAQQDGSLQLSEEK